MFKFLRFNLKSFSQKNKAFFSSNPNRLFAGGTFLSIFSIYYYYINTHKSHVPYLCSEKENPKEKASQFHHPSILRTYLKDKNLVRFHSLEHSNRPHVAFYYDGVRKMLSTFDLYEVYSYEPTIEKYQKKQHLLSNEKQEFGALYLLFKTKDISQGHRNITHGGLIATMIDHLMGRTSELVSDGENVATANLTVNYRKPVPVGKEHLIEVRFEKIEKERKIFLKCKVVNEKQETCIEANGLFLKVKW